MSIFRYDGETLAALGRGIRRGHHVHLVVAYEGRPRAAGLFSATPTAVQVLWEDVRTVATVATDDILFARISPRHPIG